MSRRHVLLASTFAMVLAVATGAVALYKLASPERIKAEAQQLVREKWNRDLAVAAIDVSILPRPVVSASGVAVDGFGKAERVTTTLQVLPLLAGKMRPSHIVIERASFDDPKGGADWRVDRARIEAGRGWHDVDVDGQVSRQGQVAHVTAHFADLSGLGRAGSTTRGKLGVEWGETRMSAEGEFRLDGIRGQRLHATLGTKSLDDVFAFMGNELDRTAPLEVAADVSDDGERLRFDNLRVSLGKMHVTGQGTLVTSGDKPVLEAKLTADRIDWRQALVDAGHAPTPSPPTRLIFNDRPLPWGALKPLKGMTGGIAISSGSLKLRNGIEMQQVQAHMGFDDDRVDLRWIRTQMLGGSAAGRLRLDGTKKTAHLEGSGEGLLLERWFRERGRPHPFTGGPMQVSASLRMAGPTWRDLAASVTGPLTIRMGPGVFASPRAGEWEALMVAFSKKASKGDIEFECAAAALQFESGVARGDNIVGARSTVTRLLTSGEIDMREEQVDLRGKLHTRPDAGVGLATIANDLQIHGPVRKMQMRLDPEKKPAAVAKGIAAVATAGLSVLATSAARASQGDTDPCAAVASASRAPDATYRIARSSVR